MEVYAFERLTERVPEVEASYVFDNDTTLSILAGFAKKQKGNGTGIPWNREVYPY